MKQLSRIFEVVKEKCVNCHRCISVCPVKLCNDGSEDHVEVNENLCIGCGECLKACDHEARVVIDDFDKTMKDLRSGVRMVAIVAPAVASNFPGGYLRLNGWLKSLGVRAFFDVSFGAELTVKSYLAHVNENKPKAVIAQPCPALVTYIQIYKPELIPHLAPADSPMLHTCKMVKEYYPEYRDCKQIVISPCMAKKREFDETGIGDYNMTMLKIGEHLESQRISLSSFPEVDYDNKPAERAVLFSTPGGLLQTAQREVPDIGQVARKIEGPSIVYEYLDHLPEEISRGRNPLLIDCLNCDLGCNGGTATSCKHKSPDELDKLIDDRRKDMQKRYEKTSLLGGKKVSKRKITQTIDAYWKPGLYGRRYENLSGNLKEAIQTPSKKELDEVYKSLLKTKKEDFKNCSACGYNSCEKMAVAIFNGLNRKENCHFFLHESIHGSTRKAIDETVGKLADMSGIIDSNSSAIARSITEIGDNTQTVASRVSEVSSSAHNANDSINSLATAAEEMTVTIQDIAKNSEKANLMTRQAVSSVDKLESSMSALSAISKEIQSVMTTIVEISDQTKLLALNATIESARAGEAGKGFAVVAGEVKDLAKQTTIASEDIGKKLERTSSSIETAIIEIKGLSSEISGINEIVTAIATAVEEQTVTSKDIAGNISNAAGDISNVAHNIELSSQSTENISASVGGVRQDVGKIIDLVGGLKSLVTQLSELQKANDALVD